MCFSPTASFVASAILIPMGLYCVLESLKKNRRYFFLALLPLLFGIQQIFEGFLWLVIRNGDDQRISFFSLLFLFFAFGFWPFYCPLINYSIEDKGTTKSKLLLVLLIGGTILGMLIYVPLVLGSTSFTTEVVNRSIAYETDRGDLLRNVYTLSYFVVTVVPFAISSNKDLRIFGMMLVGSIILTFAFYSYAFFSVWCFFAALISAYILYVIWNIDDREHCRAEEQTAGR